MDQHPEVLHKGEKGVKQLGLAATGIREPLDQPPAKAVEVDAADEIELGACAGKAGGLNVKKEQVLPGRNALQGIGRGKGDGMLDGFHVRILLSPR